MPNVSIDLAPHASAGRWDRVERAEAPAGGPVLSPILGGLPKRHLRQIAKIAYVRPFREGTAIVKEGAVDSTFYLIVEGKARAEKGGKVVGRLKPGDFIGEIALFDPGPRAATVLADTPVTCVSIAGRDFRQLLEHEPALVTPILQVMARRLRSFLRSDL